MPELIDPAGQPLFETVGLSRDFHRSGAVVHAVDQVNLTVQAGQRLGIVGESGSGKTTLVRMLDALLKPTSGEIRFRGEPITGRPDSRLGDLRSSVAMVFQDPRSSLDPRMRVGHIITEPLRSRLLRKRADAPIHPAERLAQVLQQVGLPPDSVGRYPHEFSGGQRQRIAIARALASKPEVLIADEAVSALDVSVRAHVLNLIADLVNEYGLTLLFVSHDLSVVRYVCDSVLVMHGGHVVETGPIEQVYEQPEQDYTRALLASVPKVRTARPSSAG